MDQSDDDIEFDFFEDEPATGESQPRRVRLPQAGVSKPRRSMGPPRGTAPLIRLLGLVVFVVLLVLLFALVLNSCGTSKHDAYASYMGKIDKIAAGSTANGKAVSAALSTPGLKLADLVAKLNGIADGERQNVKAAEDSNPPGRLRVENAHLVEALQLRVSGISGLANAFEKTASASTANASTRLAEQASRLLASDVVWDDLFTALTKRELQSEGISGVSVPDSHSLTSVDFISAHSMALVLGRIRPASTGGNVTGVHGTNIVSVKALPGGPDLVTGSLNTITATTGLAIQVTVLDSGEAQEVHIPVQLTIQGNPAIVLKQTITTINPQEQAVVTFTGLGKVTLAHVTTLTVDVATVKGEKVASNNTAQYQVIFSLPG